MNQWEKTGSYIIKIHKLIYHSDLIFTIQLPTSPDGQWISHTPHQHCLSPRSPTPPTGQWTSYTHPTDNAWAHDSQHYPLDRLKGLGRGTCNTPNARRRCCSLAFLRNSEGVSDMGRRSVSLEGKDSCSSLSFRIVSLVWQWMRLDQIQHPEECLWQFKKLWVTIFSLQCWWWSFMSFCSLCLMAKSLFLTGYSSSFAKSISSRVLFSFL